MTAGLTQVTERFKFLVAFRPGLMLPTLAAHMAATYQRISGSATTSASRPGTSGPVSSCTSSASCGAAAR